MEKSKCTFWPTQYKTLTLEELNYSVCFYLWPMKLCTAAENHKGQDWFHQKLMVINFKMSPQTLAFLLYYIGKDGRGCQPKICHFGLRFILT